MINCAYYILTRVKMLLYHSQQVDHLHEMEIYYAL
jgi:hypothetical protein